MARKRYVSTDISTDSRIRRLAERSEFAALLYTWMIPHAADDATLSSDPDELLMLVVPGFRWRTADDVSAAIDLMAALGLVLREGDRLRFPEKAFYKAQSYITAERRGRAVEPAPPPVSSTPTSVSANHRISPQNAAELQTAAVPPQNPTSFKSSSSFKSLSFKTPAGVLSASADDPPRPGGDSDQVDVVYEHFKARVQPKSRLCPRKKIAARLKRFTVDELREGIDHFAEDPWWMEHNAARGAAWFFDSDQHSEQFLLLQPRASPTVPLRSVGILPDVPPDSPFLKFREVG